MGYGFCVLQPRDYQTRTVDAICARWQLSRARIACVAPTGAGKTAMGCLVILRYPRDQKWVWLCHTRDLVEQSARALEREFPGQVGIVMAGAPSNPFARIQVCSVQTLLTRGFLPDGSVILDECFPGETLVGGRRIDSISVGDTVDSVDHKTGMVKPARVTRVFEKRAYSLWRLRIGATVIRCTWNHPIFVKGRGYVQAQNIAPGDLLCLWDHLHEETVRRRARSQDLLEGMFEQAALPDHGIDESSLCQRAHEGEQPHESCRGEAQTERHLEAYRSQAEGSRWQRERANGTTEALVGSAGARLAAGVGYPHGAPSTWDPNQLQNRPSSPGAQDCDRSGWEQSSFPEAERTGQEEGDVLVWARVDRSESDESTGDGSFVYNLEVEGNHTYFANGVLVHNCHHYGAEEWGAFLDRLGERPALGLTATPQRADGVGLRGIFNALIVAAHYSELIRGGYIVPARTLRPAKRLRGVAQDPVTAYLKLGEGRPGFTFCRTVDIARDTAAKYSAFGVPAACVDYETEGRGDIIARLGRDLQMLTSVYALTEGVDVPAASCCVLARGVGHPSILLQIGGRILRASPGKSDALFIDLPGVTWDLGLIHEDREYSLDGITRKPGHESLRVCQKCGFTELSGPSQCSRCGFELPPQDLRPRVHGAELTEHAPKTDLEKTLQLSTLLAEAKRRGYDDYWVQVKYKHATGELPHFPPDTERRMNQFARLKDEARRRGISAGYAAVRYKALYGVYPPREW